MEEEINSTLRTDVPMSFRVTAEERLQIIQTAKERNMSVSNFLRLIALGQSDLPKPDGAQLETTDENDLTFENQLLLEENELLKKQISSDAIIIPCTKRQKELLEEIYHYDVLSDENVILDGFEDLLFENTLLIALFVLPNLKKLDVNFQNNLFAKSFINSQYDCKEFYPLLKLDHDEFGDAIFESISELSSIEEERVTKIINQNTELKNNVTKYMKMLEETMKLIQK